MAPALVHFLGGAALLLVLATPIAFRDARVHRTELWLVTGGGIWALIPDLHHVVPVGRGVVRSLHDSPWADLFAFHYALDSPVARARPLEGIAASIAVFCLAVGLFRVAVRADPERSRRARRVVSRLGIAIGALFAAATVGGMLSATGRVDAAAALVGRDGTLTGVVLLLTAGVAGSLAVARIVPDRYARRPLAGSLIGLQLGLVAWVAGIAVILPLWARTVLEASLPVPFVDWPSLLALALAGTLAGGAVTTVRRLVVPARGDAT